MQDMEKNKLLTMLICGLSVNFCANLLLASQTVKTCNKDTNVCFDAAEDMTEKKTCDTATAEDQSLKDRGSLTIEDINQLLDNKLETSGQSVADLTIHKYFNDICDLLDEHLSVDFSENSDNYNKHTKEILEFVLCARRFRSGELKPALCEYVQISLIFCVMTDLFRVLAIWSEESAEQYTDSEFETFLYQELEAYEKWLIELK